MSPRLQAVRVVVPAHDEAETLPEHLDAMWLALQQLSKRRPDLDVTVTVVLDDCHDGSLSLARERSWVDTLEVDHLCVGAARHAGVIAARPTAAPTDRTWVACTDADTTVPPDWLCHQVALAERGADLVLGTVRPDLPEQPLLSAWRARHVLSDGHPHVHGANLGVRLSTYDAVGGFAPVTTGEDVRLAAAVQASGARVVSTSGAFVRTSARLDGRAPRGFAAYLLALTLG